MNNDIDKIKNNIYSITNTYQSIQIKSQYIHDIFEDLYNIFNVNNNLLIIDVNPDGNCFFHSVYVHLILSQKYSLLYNFFKINKIINDISLDNFITQIQNPSKSYEYYTQFQDYLLNESKNLIDKYNEDAKAKQLLITESTNTKNPITQSYAYIFTKHFNCKIFVIIFIDNVLSNLEFTPENNSDEVEEFIVLINKENTHYNLLYYKDSNFSIRKALYDYIKCKTLLAKKKII